MLFAVPGSGAKKRSLRLTALTAVVASLSMLIVDAGPAAAEFRRMEAAMQEQAPAQAPTDDSLQRPDAVSAQVTARALGKPVEDLSQRRETSMVFANPDGTWRMDAFGLPKFGKNAAGRWVDLGGSAEFTDAGEAFTGAGAQLSVSEGGDAREGITPLATLTGVGKDSGENLVLGWEGELPAPALDGTTATYSGDITVPVEAAPGSSDSATPEPAPDTPDTDSPAPKEGTGEPADPATSAPAEVIVEATRTGFSHFVELDKAPEGDVVLRFPLTLSKGLKASVTEDGAIEVRDADDDLAFFAPRPLMWDAAVNPASGLPANEVPVKTSIVSEDGGQVLVLRAGADWLTDPGRKYPVTIDPTWTQEVSGDTWIYNDSSAAHPDSPELRVGTFDGGTTKARSFLRVDTSPITGKKILDAKLQVNNFWSNSCTSSNILARRVLETWSAYTMTWADQPSITSTDQGSYGAAKGFDSSCPAGNAYFPVTAITQYWADNPAENFGLRLSAETETSSSSWRRYRSLNHVLGADDPAEPHLQVTYNSYPNTPASAAFGAGQEVLWKDAATGVTTRYVKTTKPTLSAVVADPDGGNVRIGVDITDGSVTVWPRLTGPYVASGGRSARVPDANTPTLIDGKNYTTNLWTGDGGVWSKGSTLLGFTVDVTAPTAPTVTADNVTNNGWVDTKPSSNTFTFASTAADMVKFQYSQDGGAFKDLSASGSPKQANLGWVADGAHELRVRAVDKAQNISAATTFKFGFGGAALTSPKNGTSTTDTFRVVATAPKAATGTVTPKIYWRAAGTANGAGFSDALGSSDGWTIAETLPALAAGTGVTVDRSLDAAAAAAELGKDRVPALIDVQVCFTYTTPSLTRCTWTKTAGNTSVVRLPHAFGNGYPVAEAGPGQAALYTGELNLSETDAAVEAGGTGLSVSRVYSSLAASAADAGLFGPGWRPSFEGPDAGLAGYLVADTTGTDGTVSLIGNDESALTFRQPGGTKTASKTGTYEPVGDDAEASGLKLEIAGAGTEQRIILTEADGTATQFIAGGLREEVRYWDPEKVIGPASAGTVSFTREDGRITRILAPAGAGISCPATGTLNKGCRALEIEYAATSADGKIAGQVASIAFTAWDPVANKMDTVTVADYVYDSNGRLTKVTDPRSGLSTAYTYQGANTSAGVPALASVTESGLAAHKFVYGAGNGGTAPTGSKPSSARTLYPAAPTCRQPGSSTASTPQEEAPTCRTSPPLP